MDSSETLFLAAVLTDESTYCQPLQPIEPTFTLYITLNTEIYTEFDSHLDAESGDSKGGGGSQQPPRLTQRANEY